MIAHGFPLVGELLPDAEADPSRTEPFTNTEIGTQWQQQENA